MTLADAVDAVDTFIMAPVTLRAHYDGKHIVLDERFDFPVNAPLLITVLSGESEQVREGNSLNWTALSIQNLARAYGDDEPEYSVADVQS